MRNLRPAVAGIVGVILVSLYLGACEDDGPTQPERDMRLVGTWKRTKHCEESPSDTLCYDESQLDEMGLVWLMRMEADGTVEHTFRWGGGDSTETQTGTWTASAGKLTISLGSDTGDGVPLVGKYTIDGNILAFTMESETGDEKLYLEFTKQ